MGGGPPVRGHVHEGSEAKDATYVVGWGWGMIRGCGVAIHTWIICTTHTGQVHTHITTYTHPYYHIHTHTHTC